MSSAQRTLKKRVLPPLMMTTGQILRIKKDVKSPVPSKCFNEGETCIGPDPIGFMEQCASDFLNNNSGFLDQYVRTYCSLKEITDWLNERLHPTTARVQMTEGNYRDRQASEMDILCPRRWSTTALNEVGSTSDESLYEMYDEERADERLTLKKSMAIFNLARNWRSLDDRIAILSYLRECLTDNTNAEKAFIFVMSDGDKKGLIPVNKETGALEDEHRISIDNQSRSCPTAVAAKTLETLRIKDVALDDRFPMVHHYLRSNVQSIITCPLINQECEVIAVAEVHRSLGKPPFSHDDEETTNGFCNWAAVILSYADLCHETIVQQKVYDYILHVTKILFSKVDNLSSVMMDTLMTTKALVHAKIAILYEVEEANNVFYCRISDNGEEDGMEWIDDEIVEKFELGSCIPGEVAITKTTELIQNATKDKRFYRNLYDRELVDKIESVMCMPVVINDETVSVIQLINHEDGDFTPIHLKHLKVFGVYCALALKAAKMYQTIYKSEQTYQVALEVVSYHTKLNEDEFRILELQEVPTYVRELQRLSFEPWRCVEDTRMVYIVYMFKDLFITRRYHGLRFEQTNLLKFILTIRKCYVSTPYHNWQHAFAVMQSVYVFITRYVHNEFSVEEEMALFLSAMCHDADYHPREVDRPINHDNPFLSLYTTPVFEMRHFHAIASALKNSDTNVLFKLPTDKFKKTLTNLQAALKATNVHQFFRNKTKVENCLNSKGKLSVLSDEERMSRLGVCMMSCDLCNFYKEWDVHFTAVLIEMQDFWIQSADEKVLFENMCILYRDYFADLPECMVRLITHLVSPAYQLTTRIVPKYKVSIDRLRAILSRWEVMLHFDKSQRLRHLRRLEESIHLKNPSLANLSFSVK